MALNGSNIAPSIMMPALTLWNNNGQVDREATAAYAQKASATWIDTFMLSGSIGEGNTSSPKARRQTLEVWADSVPAERLLGCVWSDEDYVAIKEAGVRAVFVLQGLENSDELLRTLEEFPPGSFIYSHPTYTSVPFTPNNAELACRQNVLPAGAKISKISLDEIRQMRRIVGDDFQLYDGRSRHIQESIDAGANGVVVVPLALVPDDLPERNEIETLQHAINEIQSLIDAQGSVPNQARFLAEKLRSTL